jgi:hypothetical protein
MSESTTQQTKKPWPVIIMVSMLAVVIIAGFLLRPQSEDQKTFWLDLLGTTNHGELMNPPLDVEPGLLQEADGSLWTELENSNWKLVVVNSGVCEIRCEELIYLGRQAHARLNRRAPLLERGFLNFGVSGLDTEQFAESYPDIHQLQADQDAYIAWVAGSNLESEQQAVMLLINPINVMQMFYTDSHDGSGLLEDLEHLMKLAN